MFEKTLYGLNKNGGFKVWQIRVREIDGFGAINIVHGQLGSDNLIDKGEVVKIGKQGRTPYEQAVFQASARVKKQIDKGYRETKEELAELPVLAMLAMDFLKVGHRMTYPCYVSRKLDGVRAIAHRNGDIVTLKSRTNQPYSVKHIEEALLKVMPDNTYWDGELYIENSCLEDIVSAVKKPNSNTPDIEFIVFDVVSDKPFIERLLDVRAIPRNGDVRPIIYDPVKNQDEVVSIQKRYTDEGYEGIMIRSVDGMYESGKRSAGLMKRKDFLDSEFEIVDVIADKQGYGVFVLKNDLNDLTFQCVMCDMNERKHYIENKELYIGKFLTVKYQSRYKGTMLPQFPTGVTVREGEWVDGEFIAHE